MSQAQGYYQEEAMDGDFHQAVLLQEAFCGTGFVPVGKIHVLCWSSIIETDAAEVKALGQSLCQTSTLTQEADKGRKRMEQPRRRAGGQR